jgi:hypothetical protein
LGRDKRAEQAESRNSTGRLFYWSNTMMHRWSENFRIVFKQRGQTSYLSRGFSIISLFLSQKILWKSRGYPKECTEFSTHFLKRFNKSLIPKSVSMNTDHNKRIQSNPIQGSVSSHLCSLSVHFLPKTIQSNQQGIHSIKKIAIFWYKVQDIHSSR